MSNQKVETIPKRPRVIVTHMGNRIDVRYENANWPLAVDLLLDALQAARLEEKKVVQEKKDVIQKPGGLYMPS